MGFNSAFKGLIPVSHFLSHSTCAEFLLSGLYILEYFNLLS